MLFRLMSNARLRQKTKPSQKLSHQSLFEVPVFCSVFFFGQAYVSSHGNKSYTWKIETNTHSERNHQHITHQFITLSDAITRRTRDHFHADPIRLRRYFIAGIVQIVSFALQFDIGSMENLLFFRYYSYFAFLRFVIVSLCMDKVFYMRQIFEGF